MANWGQLTLWGARVAWLAVAIVGGRAVGSAVASRSDAVQLVATIGAWAGWAAGAVALAVPGIVTLTAARAIVPAAVVVAAVAAAFDADADAVLALAVPAIVATVLVMAADTGRVFVQASAYGDEQRFVLRPPLGYLGLTAMSWGLWLAAVITAPLAWAAGAWVLAAAATALAAAGSWLFPVRWHQLSRRWLVSVPAGFVVHDPVVLAETCMLPLRWIAAVGVNGRRHGAPGPLDLTGPTPGLAVALVLAEPATVVLAPRPATPRGRAIHVTAVRVAPSRPGSVLREAARRGVTID